MNKVIGGRALLNLPGHESTAAIVAEIEDARSFDLERISAQYWGPDYSFQISDCTRVITLDVSFHNAEARANNLHKIDTLISTLKEFRKGLVIANRRIDKARKDDDE